MQQDKLLSLGNMIKKLGLRNAIKSASAQEYTAELERAIVAYQHLLPTITAFEFIERQIVGLIELEFEENGVASPFTYKVEQSDTNAIYANEDGDGYRVEYFSADEVPGEMKGKELVIDPTDNQVDDTDIELESDKS